MLQPNTQTFIIILINDLIFINLSQSKIQLGFGVREIPTAISTTPISHSLGRRARLLIHNKAVTQSSNFLQGTP